MGRGSGGRGSGGRFSSIDVEYSFELFSQDDNGIVRSPQNGTFLGAIENLTLSFRSDFVNLENNIIPIEDSGDEFEIPNIASLDLTASIEGDNLKYSISGSSELESFGIDELFFERFIPEITLESGEPVDLVQATSNIEYIVENNLLFEFSPQSDIFSFEGREVVDDNGTPNDFSDDVVEPFSAFSDTFGAEFERFPEAVNDSTSTEANTPVTIDVLANDSDPDEALLSIDSFDANSSQGGTVSLDDNGTPDNSTDDQLSYTPAAGFSGSDSFDYTISNGSETSTATVTVEVSASDPVDPIFGTDGSNFLTGTQENDTIFGLGGSDLIRGNGGNDSLTGDGGQDLIEGGNGDDLLQGGSGQDLLRGQAGSDTFVFGRGDGRDLIQDFELGVDKIGLIEGELTFDDLTITNLGFTSTIGVADTGELLAVVQKNNGSGGLTEDMFVSVSDISNTSALL